MYKNKVEISPHQFLSLDSISDLAQLLTISRGVLINSSLFPAYNTFHIPKKAGGYRKIDAPDTQVIGPQPVNQHLLQLRGAFAGDLELTQERIGDTPVMADQ